MTRSGLALAAFAAVLFFARGAAAETYSCIDADHTPDKQWEINQEQAVNLLTDIEAQPFGKKQGFTYRFCGVQENGQYVILINFLKERDGHTYCGSDDNFALFYDPQKRTFSDKLTGDFCTTAPSP